MRLLPLLQSRHTLLRLPVVLIGVRPARCPVGDNRRRLARPVLLVANCRRREKRGCGCERGLKSGQRIAWRKAVSSRSPAMPKRSTSSSIRRRSTRIPFISISRKPRLARCATQYGTQEDCPNGEVGRPPGSSNG